SGCSSYVSLGILDARNSLWVGLKPVWVGHSCPTPFILTLQSLRQRVPSPLSQTRDSCKKQRQLQQRRARAPAPHEKNKGASLPGALRLFGSAVGELLAVQRAGGAELAPGHGAGLAG